MLKGKYCKNHDEVFSRYIGEGKVAWVPKVNLSIEEAVKLLHGAGAVALVAHPGVQRDEAGICRYAMENGIDGFECTIRNHSNSTTAPPLVWNCARSIGCSFSGRLGLSRCGKIEFLLWGVIVLPSSMWNN
jgi:hypothetical protein